MEVLQTIWFQAFFDEAPQVVKGLDQHVHCVARTIHYLHVIPNCSVQVILFRIFLCYLQKFCTLGTISFFFIVISLFLLEYINGQDNRACCDLRWPIAQEHLIIE